MPECVRRAAVRGGVVMLLLLCWLGVAEVTAAARAADGPAGLDIVVFGDSQAAGVARGLQRLLIDEPRFKVLNRTHPGASIVHERREWLAPIRDFLAHDKADIAIVMFGANDRIDMREGEKYLHFRTAAWHEEYVKRVDEVMAALAAAKLKTIWCGNPIARSDTYSLDMSYINRIYADEAPHYGIRFEPLWSAVVGGDGKYTAFGKALDGVTRRLRGDDGIHFTSAGYELIADKIAALIPAIPVNGQ